MKINQENVFPSLAPFWEDFFGRDMMERTGWRSNSSIPAVNIEEKPHAFEISLAAPGLQQSDFAIELDNGVLTVSSKKEEKHEQHHQEGKYTRREFRYHTFSRSFTLPEAVDTNKIEARYTNGILSIHLPKKEPAKEQAVKQITIQ
jgi:HSP20 family protein